MTSEQEQERDGAGGGGGGAALAVHVADVVIVGAGPAGLACAADLVDSTRLSVAVVDAGHGPGGQYWRHPAPVAGSAIDVTGLHHDLATFHSLVASLDAGRAAGRLTLHTEHHVWTVVATAGPTVMAPALAPVDGYEVHVVDRSGGPGHDVPVRLRCRAVVIATGAFDRALPFPGWDLPGVMTAGGLQALLKGGGVAAGHRVAVAGSGPFLLPVAAGLVRSGAQVVGVFEANRRRRWLREVRPVAANAGKLREGAGYALDLLRHRVPVRTARMVVAAHGTDRLEAVDVAPVDADGGPDVSRARRYEVDALGVGWGFTPQLDLAVTLGVRLVPRSDGTQVIDVDHLQRTSRSGVFAAGETTGVGGAALAVAEGRLAAIGVAADLGADLRGYLGGNNGGPQGSTSVPDALVASVRRLRAFAAAIERAHPLPAGWSEVLQPDTTICRCEEVRWAQVRDAVECHGARDARQVKQLTRSGMGWCQGRVCDLAASLLSAGTIGAAPERLVAAPMTLGCLAAAVEPTKPADEGIM